MPLHVNLYHEVQRQELARRRDPLRLSMLAGLVVAIGFVAYYFVALGRSHVVQVAFDDTQARWASIEPKFKASKARQAELDDEIKASDELAKRVDSRFYLAPVLSEILQAVPQSVQLTHLGTDAPADDKATNSVVTMTGISSAPEPRKEAEAIRIALNNKLSKEFKNVTSVFKALDDSDQFVTLNGRRLPTATFTLEFQIQVRDPVVVAPPPVRKSRIAAAE